MNTLIVEHNAAAGAAISNRIKGWGYRVDHTNSGKDAVNGLTQEEFGLIFVDLDMPYDEGIKLIRLIRELCPKARIVTMTSHNSPGFEMEVMKQGIVCYMRKPVGVNHLRILLDHLLQMER